jgi:hypothetical protein
MHERVLPPGSRSLITSLKKAAHPALVGWTLAGGTGLALRVGHRRSDDFDFFRTGPMDPVALLDTLAGIAETEVLQQEERTLTLLARKVKISFFGIREPFLFPPQPYSFFAVADARDIALMKLVAIMNRGSRKDFVDLYTILRDGPTLRDYLELLPRRYGIGRINAYQVLMSLAFFEDAEQEPMPAMLEPFDWEECRSFFVREARSIVLPP